MMPFYSSGEEPVSYTIEQIGQMDISELGKLSVISPTKRLSDSFLASASIHVITSEDIRRSGANSIPEALRLAPGLNVARSSSHTYAISARGFNDISSNKLLVLADGRSVYSALDSGVFWELVDYPLEDIERIEVILGPGGALWGANAVNGVINIITKAATKTQGALLSGGGGTEERAFGTARFGGEDGNLSYRGYARYSDRDSSQFENGEDAENSWWLGQSGFRTDWEAFSQKFTLQGDIYSSLAEKGSSRPRFEGDGKDFPNQSRRSHGENLMARWSRDGPAGLLSAQAYYQREYRKLEGYVDSEGARVGDFEIQHDFDRWSAHELTLGLQAHLVRDNYSNTGPSRLFPASRSTDTLSAFAQDTIALAENDLLLTIGTKLEHNDYTGFENAPNARLSYRLSPRQMFWGAVSRAVRVPSRIERDIHIELGETKVDRLVRIVGHGNDGFDSEKLVSYELGARRAFNSRLSLDIGAFFNDYDDLRGVGMTATEDEEDSTTIEFFPDNSLTAHIYGGELAAKWKASSSWELKADFSILNMHFAKAGRFGSPTGSSPEHQASLRSLLDLPWDLELDASLRYVDSLPGQRTPSYLTGDIRLGWRPCMEWELSVAAQNLYDTHSEFGTNHLKPGKGQEIETGVYAKATYRL